MNSDREKLIMDHNVVKNPDLVKQEKAKERKRRKEMLDSFREWLKIDHEESYKYYVPFGPAVIVRLFLYKPDLKKKPKIYTSLDDDGSGREMVEAQVLPFAKVLSVGTVRAEGYDDIKIGDICTIQEDVLGVELNQKWVQYQKDVREQPSLARDVMMPPKYIPKLGMWAKYVFTGNKFEPPVLERDGYTFLIPQMFLKTRFDHRVFVTDNK